MIVSGGDSGVGVGVGGFGVGGEGGFEGDLGRLFDDMGMAWMRTERVT
jgi:hypothetical protein